MSRAVQFTDTTNLDDEPLEIMGDSVPPTADERPVYFLELTEAYIDPSQDDLDRLRAQFESQFDGPVKPRLLIAPPGCRFRPAGESSAQAQMERLLGLLALGEEERAFVGAALGKAEDRGEGFWGVLADYLEEKGDPSAPRYRRLR